MESKEINELFKKMQSTKLEFSEENHHVLAIKIASTIKTQTLQELLTNADKIERWMSEPSLKQRERAEIRIYFRENE